MGTKTLTKKIAHTLCQRHYKNKCLIDNEKCDCNCDAGYQAEAILNLITTNYTLKHKPKPKSKHTGGTK